jgi:ribose transport system permease protein
MNLSLRSPKQRSAKDAPIDVLSTGMGHPDRAAPDNVPSRGRSLRFIARFAVWGSYLVGVLILSLLRPDEFLAWQTAQAILSQCAIPLLLATALTMVLVVGEFDLSFAAVVGLAASVSVILMTHGGLEWVAAASIAVLVALAVGLANGYVTAYLGAQSIVATLAAASIATGLEYLIGNQETLYTGLAPQYVSIGQSVFFGVAFPAWIAVALAIVVGVVMHQTELGRYMYAVGSNPEAARLAGLRVRRLKVVAFATVGLFAGLAGLLISAQSSAYYPGAGEPYLLPAFGAVFLGAAAVGGTVERFTIAGTLFGVLFFQTMRIGLTILNLAPGWVNFAEGAFLLAAALLALLTRPKR